MRAAAHAVAAREGLSNDWLNDAVKEFFSEHGAFDVFEELSNLRIYVPHPAYLLAIIRNARLPIAHNIVYNEERSKSL